jgi:hypothetical protein
MMRKGWGEGDRRVMDSRREGELRGQGDVGWGRKGYGGSTG